MLQAARRLPSGLNAASRIFVSVQRRFSALVSRSYRTRVSPRKYATVFPSGEQQFLRASSGKTHSPTCLPVATSHLPMAGPSGLL
jgi:hypothetical protein